jgi:hypothetical protein
VNMTNTVALTKQEQERAALSAPLQSERASRLTTEQSAPADAGSGPILWTVWEDYYATGEGRALMACIMWAASEEEARSHFAKTFDPWYAKGCDALPGVVRNEITVLLWSAQALDLVESVAGRGAAVNLHAWLHFNLS